MNGRFENHVCLDSFLNTNFLCFPSKVWISPFSLSIWPGTAKPRTRLHSGEKTCKAISVVSVGRERAAEP